MNVRSGFIDSIGNTPLIKLRAASEATGCDYIIEPGSNKIRRLAGSWEKFGLIQADPARCSVSSEICDAWQFPFQLADGPRPYL
jgi:hypothetical protein